MPEVQAMLHVRDCVCLALAHDLSRHPHGPLHQALGASVGKAVLSDQLQWVSSLALHCAMPPRAGSLADHHYPRALSTLSQRLHHLPDAPLILGTMLYKRQAIFVDKV